MSLDFSVAIPAYNSARFIGETLEAILGQTHPPAEVIVVDDGSTDDTNAIIRQFGPRVSCIQIQNSGPGAARKVAIESCNSEWVATCDSDDIWMPDHLSRRAELIALFPSVTFTFSDCISIGSNATTNYSRVAEAPADWLANATKQCTTDYVLFQDAYRAFLKFNPAFPSGWAFRADAYRKIGGINPVYSRRKAEDTEIMRRFLIHPHAVIAGDLRPTWSYRRHGTNFSEIQWKNILGKADILHDQLKSNVIPKELHDEVLDEIIRTRTEAFNMAFWEGDYRGSLGILPTIPIRNRNLKMYIRALISKLRS